MFFSRVFFVVLIISFMNLNPTAKAGIFGPKNYEECIIESMKGVTSDVAAKEIQRACRKKFPLEKKEWGVKELNPEQVKKLSITNVVYGRNNQESLSAEVYNGNEDLDIWAVTIAVTYILNNEKTTRQYHSSALEKLGDPWGLIKPLRRGNVYFNVIPGDLGEFGYEYKVKYNLKIVGGITPVEK